MRLALVTQIFLNHDHWVFWAAAWVFQRFLLFSKHETWWQSGNMSLAWKLELSYLLLTLQKSEHCFNSNRNMLENKVWWDSSRMSWEGNYLPGWHVRDLWLNHSLSWGGCKRLVLCAWGSPVSLWLMVVPEGLSTCHSRMKGSRHRIKVFLAWDDWICS